ncbi:MAG: DNA polymerase III subunit delta' [Lactovum sp.]
MKIEEIQPRLFQIFSRLKETNNLSHAYLFIGNFGNFDLSIWLAQAIFCQEEKSPCGKCRICQLVEINEFTELKIIEPEGQMIKVAQIRALLGDFSSTGFESDKKVLIIREADKLGESASNALLKTIEEPTSEYYIFLLTEKENLILPTIRSRVQSVVFPKNKDYLSELLKKEKLQPSEIELLLELVTSVEQALELSQSSWYLSVSHQLEDFVEKCQQSTDEAFLSIVNFITLFKEKKEEELIFSILLLLFNRKGMHKFTEKSFKAEKMWHSNVSFQSCLESICL